MKEGSFSFKFKDKDYSCVVYQDGIGVYSYRINKAIPELDLHITGDVIVLLNILDREHIEYKLEGFELKPFV